MVYSDDFGDSPAGDIDAREGEFDGLPACGKLSIGPYTVLIYSQDRPE